MPAERTLHVTVEDGSELACRWLVASPGEPTILYLHGFGSSQDGEKARFFRRQSAGEGLGLLSLDFRGHGRSGGDIRGLTLTRCLADAAAGRAFLAAQGVDHVVVMGSSMGGLVGLWHAALAPRGLVAGLYIAPAVGLAGDLAARLGERRLERWRRQGEIEFENEMGRFAVGWEMFEDLGRYPADRLAERHRVPSLLFQGRLDDQVSWRRVAEFSRRAAGPARLCLYEDGDHRLLDRRHEMWTLMLEHLRENETRRGGAP